MVGFGQLIMLKNGLLKTKFNVSFVFGGIIVKSASVIRWCTHSNTCQTLILRLCLFGICLRFSQLKCVAIYWTTKTCATSFI